MKATEIVKGADYAYSTSNGYWETRADRVTVLSDTTTYHLPPRPEGYMRRPQTKIVVGGTAYTMDGKRADAYNKANAVLARRGDGAPFLALFAHIRMPWAEYEQMLMDRAAQQESIERRRADAQATYDAEIADAKVIVAILGLQMEQYHTGAIHYDSKPGTRPISMDMDTFARLLELALKGAQA